MNFALPRRTRLALGCVMLAATGFASRANAEEYVKSYAVTGRANVIVHADDSGVHVTTWDTNQVEFRVTYEGIAVIQVGGKLRIDSQQNGDQVELTEHVGPNITFGFSNRRIRTEVHMPKNADLELETTDGGIEISSLNGNITLHTADGGIKASQLSGKIDIHSNDGGINADALTGELRMHTGDGAVSANNLDGKCDVSSGDGSIHVAGRFDSLDIKSGEGGVSASVAAGSRMSSAWSIRTGDGAIELSVPADFQATLDATTKDGRISLDLPVTVEGSLSKTQIHGTLNGGGPSLIIRTGDGSIRLNRS
jgi:DUF4097 and DUF4098 domain-containing protein YvlB